MEKFKINYNWIEYHSGELIVEAVDSKEAIELLKMEQNRLLEILIYLYASDTFNCLSDISVVQQEEKSTEESDVVIIDSEIIFNNKKI